MNYKTGAVEDYNFTGQELTLITHDSDFRTQDISILTTNPSPLRR